ncbi:MAG: PAS domain-containing protein [Gammaproteobacteria bacterium]|jgi:PAS domain S-box-containing protein
MTKYDAVPTGNERVFDKNEFIVSKTDATGRITYANDVFCRVALYSEHELIGQPHSLVRHPDMPRCVFKLLWDTIQDGREIFAYVKNMARNGDYYWVFAHVTPSYDSGGAIAGFHSNRRVPERDAVAKVEPIYRQLIDVENGHANRKDGMQAGFDTLVGLLQQNGIEYDEFVFSL